LELDNFQFTTWDCLENISLPFLKVLRAKHVLVDNLKSLIKSAGGSLIEMSATYRTGHNTNNNKRIIQAIYQNCPNLKYLKLIFRNDNILEL